MIIAWIVKLLERLGLRKPSGVYYIGGSEVLPPPMKPEEEAAALAALQNGESWARDKLIEHNLRLVVYIARKFENTSVGTEDLISIGTIGLIKAVGTFKPDKKVKLGHLCFALCGKRNPHASAQNLRPARRGFLRRAAQFRLGRQRTAALRYSRHRAGQRYAPH